MPKRSAQGAGTIRQCQDRLKAGSAWNDGDFVFCNELGEPLSRSTTYHSFKAIIASIGLPEMRFHDLRHTYASLSRRAGADLRLLQKAMGHASITVTAHTYADLFDDELDDIATALDSLDDSFHDGGS